jgi:hypothetical protein
MALRLGSDGKRFFKGGALDDVRIYSTALNADEIAVLSRWNTLRTALAKDTLSDASMRDLQLMYLNRKDTAYQALGKQMDEVERLRREIRRRGAVTHVMQEKEDSKAMARILYRGMYDQPREEVTPEVPSVLPPMSKDLPRDRYGLAMWLTDAANPLMTRVTVNRFWLELFGTGIVKTAEDFGSQGEAPSHPELLDYLAVNFRESGWDVKGFFRTIVTSSTYRQSAAATPEKLKKDAENRLLSRGPRFRMDGEIVRDFALASSGLLVRDIGGPSVRPYQPNNIWETVAMKGSDTRVYKPDSGEKLYRRSMYTFWKRSAPPSSMEIFNAPTRENCTVRRERTNTPLQALVTMNDVQFVEAARRLAERTLKSGATFDQRLDFITSHTIARVFDLKERKVVRGAYQDFLKHYDSNPQEAAKLVGTGESKADASLPAAELAAWTMVSNEVLNLDEAINK